MLPMKVEERCATSAGELMGSSLISLPKISLHFSRRSISLLANLISRDKAFLQEILAYLLP